MVQSIFNARCYNLSKTLMGNHKEIKMHTCVFGNNFDTYWRPSGAARIEQTIIFSANTLHVLLSNWYKMHSAAKKRGQKYHKNDKKLKQRFSIYTFCKKFLATNQIVHFGKISQKNLDICKEDHTPSFLHEGSHCMVQTYL